MLKPDFMRARRLVVTCAAFACTPAGNETDARSELAGEVAAISAIEEQDRVLIQTVGIEVQRLRQGSRLVVEQWRHVALAHDDAARRYRQAEALAGQASHDFLVADRDFKIAAQEYRRATIAVIALAASQTIGQAICGSTVSTRAFRARLRDEGVSLEGQDIDHVWPKALGGADHPLNYQVLDSSLNRSLGAGVIEKMMRWPLATLQGMAVSAVAVLSC